MRNYIYGAGGHGKVVWDAMQSSQMDCAGFVDDKVISSWAGLDVYQLSSLNTNDELLLHLAIGSCAIREAFVAKLSHAKYFSVIHAAAIIAKTSQIGSGSFVAAQSIVAPYATIGKYCIINHAAVIDHDCVVGDFSHVAPQVSLGGGVCVGKGVLVGAGSVILPGLTVSDYAVIGAGAVVTKNVSAGVTVVGNPARAIR